MVLVEPGTTVSADDRGREYQEVGEAISWSTPILRDAGIDTARLDSQLLLAWALKCRREDLAREPQRRLTARERLVFEKAVALRAARRPLPYITGEQWFYGRPFKVNRAVLVPRPETELLVDFAIEKACAIQERPIRIADVGTGSGAIAISLACELDQARVGATDVSPLALKLAARNVRRYRVDQQVDLVEADLLGESAGPGFHIIVSNPPYIAQNEIADLMPEVRDYEPSIALWEGAGLDGARMHGRLLVDSWDRLVPGGWLGMELGRGHAEGLSRLAAELGWKEIETRADAQKNARMLAARKPAGRPRSIDRG